MAQRIVDQFGTDTLAATANDPFAFVRLYTEAARKSSGRSVSFGEFVFASDANELPVDFARFDGTSTDGSVRLTWQTTSETSNTGFEIQREKEEWT